MQVSYGRSQQYHVLDYTLTVPLDHFAGGEYTAFLSDKTAQEIAVQSHMKALNIFAREVTLADEVEEASQSQRLGLEPISTKPCILYLQGGPGCASPRPSSVPPFVEHLAKRFRVILLDQRGLGNSTPQNAATLGNLPLEEQVQRLSHLRADQIVGDAEALRQALLGDESWYLLGQSFGGFCILNYLSNPKFSQYVAGALVTGGLAAINHSADEIYRKTYEQTRQRNLDLFECYPEVEPIIRKVCAYLDEHEVYLPTGTRLSSRMLRTVGIDLGRSTGLESIKYLFEDPFDVSIDADGRAHNTLKQRFLWQVAERVSYHEHPLYAVIHEAIYAGASSCVAGEATQWSAERMRDAVPGFAEGANPLDETVPYYLTGEHIYPWFFDEMPELKPLKEAAFVLAEKTDWPALYNFEVLKANQVPVAAAVYPQDMYVPYEYSREDLNLVGNLKIVEFPEDHHNALRAKGPEVLDCLLAELGI